MRNTQDTLRKTQWVAGGMTLVLVLLALLVPLPVASAAPQERHIAVTASRFAFEPGTVRVNRGDTVTIRLESTDVVHGLYVDGYGVSAQAEPGRPGLVRFVADRDGAFHFRCATPCGNLHPFMIGKLIMGTGMPEFGSLYTDKEQWAMIAYLRTFLFGK